jgi:hypothetical protein
VNDQLVIEEIMKEINKFIEFNENENKAYQSCCIQQRQCGEKNLHL